MPEEGHLAGHSIPAELSSASSSRRISSSEPPEGVIPANSSQPPDSPLQRHMMLSTCIQLMVHFN